MDSRDLKEVLDAVLDGLIVVDEHGRVTRVNAEACRILETSEEKIAGEDIRRVLGPEHPLATLCAQAQQLRRAAIVDDVVVERRFGSELEIDVAVNPLGESPGPVVITMRDQTLRNSLSERHAQIEELARYGQIAAGIAHEVKNPLGGIRGAAELLKGWSQHDRARKSADLIVREVDRITALVDELMVFARGDKLATRSINLHRVLDDVLQLLGMDPLSAGSRVERIYDPSIPEMRADPDRLTQVFLNLARNALQAMEEGGGTMTITTRIALVDRLTDRAGRQIPTVLVTLDDTGPGIPADALERLATPFFTTRSDGVGLGLAVARHWVTLHHGTLGIDSQIGAGTRARVALPLYGPEATQEAR